MVSSSLESVWEPEKELKNSNIVAFIRYLAAEGFVDCDDYWQLHDWSINHREEFWQATARFLSLQLRSDWQRVFICEDPDKPFLTGSWFPDTLLNYAENLLSGADRKAAVTAYVEGLDTPQVFSLEDLRIRTSALVEHLKSEGLRKGDVAAGVVTNSHEALTAMLACAALGVVWSSCSPDFGATAILDRFEQIEPKVLFYTVSYSYNGKKFDCIDSFLTVRNGLRSSLKSSVLINPLGTKTPDELKNSAFFEELMKAPVIPKLEFVPVAFNHPLFIMFSSGTTGTPKCIVHGTGGTLIQHRKEHSLHCDFKRGDRLLYFTTCGWMMWNWMVSALASGVDLVLFEGSPAYPSLDRLWQVVADEKVSCFGTSPKFLSSCEKAGVEPGQSHDCKNLREILSTGAPLLPEQYQWVSQQFSSRVRLSSISGGTDIISCFMLGVPILPVYPGQISAPGLGMAVESWVDGRSAFGVKGELVCTKPFPSMPIGFLGDTEKKRYEAAYFSEYPKQQVWYHGDFITRTEQGGVIVHGRSDATLNPGGVRIGTAEIYRAVESLEEIQDSLAIGVQRDDDVEIWLFVVVHSTVDEHRLKDVIRLKIKSQLTPRHLPKQIFKVNAIPYTRSGKKLELSITRLFNDESIGNESVAADPAVFIQYQEIYERQALR